VIPRTLAVLLSGLVPGCFQQLVQSELVLANDAPNAWSQVVVQAGTVEVWRGALAAGDSQSISYKPPGDASFQVNIRQADGTVHEHEVGYTTTHDGQRHTIRIQADATLKYSVVANR
jgi:hypothetical protein